MAATHLPKGSALQGPKPCCCQPALGCGFTSPSLLPDRRPEKVTAVSVHLAGGAQLSRALLVLGHPELQPGLRVACQ